MIQLVVSAAIIVAGLVIALLLNTAGDMRIFGWILAGIGVFGLLSRALIQRADQDPPRRRR
jgi:hypothetical protein